MSNRRPVSSFSSPVAIHLSIIVLTALAFFVPSQSHAASCATEIPLEPNTTWQDAGQAVGEASCFRVELETVGALAVDLMSDFEASEARLEVRALEAPSRLRPVAPQHVYAWVSPGTFLIRVHSTDHQQALDPFRLQVRFAALDSLSKGELDDELEIEPDPFTGGNQCAKGELDDELEIEPDPFTGGSQCAKGELDDELEIEPDPLWSPEMVTFAKGELDDELEIEPDPFTGEALDWRSMSKASLCGIGSNDLADDLLCARRWTPGCGQDELHRVDGLRSDRGGDQDVMRLELLAPSTVIVSARGEIELALRLDDARGQRLDRAVGGVDGVRLVRSLTAGTYFLRLAGQDGAEGAYQLRIQTERH